MRNQSAELMRCGAIAWRTSSIRISAETPGSASMPASCSSTRMLAASRQKAVVSANDADAAVSADSFRTLMSLAETGALKPVVDVVLPFTQIVEAHRRVDSGHKVGSVVLTFSQHG